MSDLNNAKLTKFYKMIQPRAERTSVSDSQDTVGNYGLYGNYSFMNRLMQGSNQRQERYREYDMMDEDTDVSRALDIIAQEITGNAPKSELPVSISITAGNEQHVPSRIVVTLNAALKTWCNIHRWNRRLYPTIRATIKYGDTFYIRNDNIAKPFKYVNPKNVTGAIVPKDDVTNVVGWQLRTDYDQTVQNVNFAVSGGASEAYTVQDYSSDKIIRFGLHDDMSDEAPFSLSVLRTAYKTFKQKQMLEDSILIYRIQRAPEKRVFKLEIGKTPPHMVAQILENAKVEIKQRKIPTPYGGGNQMESIYSPMSTNEDFFFAMKNGQGSTVETLPGGQNLGQLEDLDYFYNKMWRALRIPQSYMSNNSDGSSSFNDGKVGIAYQQEIQFALYIMGLQIHFEDVLDKEFKRFILEQKLNIDPTIFKVVLPEPSNFKKYKDQELNQQNLNILSSALAIEGFSKRFAYIKYGKMSKEEVILNERMKAEELGLDPDAGLANLAKIYSPENADMGGFDGGLTGGGSGQGTQFGDDIGSDDGLQPTENNADQNNTNQTPNENSSQNSNNQ